MNGRALIPILLPLLACRPRAVPPATADQTVRDAVVLVCDTPARAKPDARGGVSMNDAIAGHLTDGIGNDRVLTTVEAWKTNGIVRKELDALMREARLTRCALRDTIGDR